LGTLVATTIFFRWIQGAQDPEVFRIEAGGVPFSLDRIHGSASRGKDKINLVPVLVTQIHHLGTGRLGEQALENGVF
jgi:hypothetical protein